METIDVIESMLNALPKSSEGIAQQFKSLGVDGYQEAAHECALACYLLMNPDIKAVSPIVINWDTIYAEKAEGEIDLETSEWDSVRNFIADFDEGSYPELIRTA